MHWLEKRGKIDISFLVWTFVFFILFSVQNLAHGEIEDDHKEDTELSDSWSDQALSSLDMIKRWNINILAFVTVLATILVVISIKHEKSIRHYKKPIFLALIIPIIGASLFLIGSTIYGNMISHTKGPVHWHADYEVWACNQKLDLVNPKGLSNRIGTSTFHEHGDDRIHVEGVVHSLEDVALGRY
ncbi:MAG: hypothetical protein AABX72_02030, partial [Nanoarchaeota archaeon]